MQFSSHLLVFMSVLVICLTEDSYIQTGSGMLPGSKCVENEATVTLLDIAKDTINKAILQYPNCVADVLNTRQKAKSLASLDVAISVISEVKKKYPSCHDSKCQRCVERPMDCSDILRSGTNVSGVYTIWPRSRILNNKSLSVYCDMNTDGGGWTVIQRRGKFSTPKGYFYKDWSSYKKGFGNLKEEFWIGNDNIFAISNQASYTIRFDLKDASGRAGYAEYSSFWIEEENANYTLHISGFHGNAGDGMSRQNKMQFSTKDRDNDLWIEEPCAVDRQGAWWYEACENSNLNGLYQPGLFSDAGFTWTHFTNGRFGLSEVEIKLRS